MAIVMSHPTTSQESALSVRGLTKRYGTALALNNANIDIKSGEFLTLLGPSGSGKTTLLRLIAGFEVPTEGEMLINGSDISRLSPADRGLGMVFQHYALFPHMTVAENVEYGLKKRRWPAEKRAPRVNEMLELVRLGSYGARYPRQLSGGQQQRVALARALAYEPKILLMDEPLGALDRALRVEMEIELRRIHSTLNTTFIYVTHDQQEALALSQRVAIMREANIVALDTPEELLRNPVDAFVASFFVNANVLPVAVVRREKEDRVVVNLGGNELSCRSHGPIDGDLVLVIRRRSLKRHVEGAGLAIRGKLTESHLLGEDRRISIQVPDVGLVVGEVAIEDSRGLSIGREVEFYIKADDLVVVPAKSRKVA